MCVLLLNRDFFWSAIQVETLKVVLMKMLAISIIEEGFVSLVLDEKKA